MKSCRKRKPRLADGNAFFDKPAGFRVAENFLGSEFFSQRVNTRLKPSSLRLFRLTNEVRRLNEPVSIVTGARNVFVELVKLLCVLLCSRPAFRLLSPQTRESIPSRTFRMR
jgi:hypothetical protein